MTRIRPRSRPTPGKMNKLESQYADYLQQKKNAGIIRDYRFEAMKFRLADRTFFTPDFMVTYPDVIEFHETKGYFEEDAKIKIKVVAALFPEFSFIAVYWKKKEWVYEEF
jgi:hypothetical protein